MLFTIALLAAAAPPVVDYGTKPTYVEGVKIGEAYVKHELADPYSAHIDWPFDFEPINEKVPFFPRTIGFATCLTINAKNAYGAYVGEQSYRIIIRNGTVIDYSAAPYLCQEMAKKGLPPAPAAKP